MLTYRAWVWSQAGGPLTPGGDGAGGPTRHLARPLHLGPTHPAAPEGGTEGVIRQEVTHITKNGLNRANVCDSIEDVCSTLTIGKVYS